MNPNLHNVADLDRIKELEAELVDKRRLIEGLESLQYTKSVKNLLARAEAAEADLVFIEKRENSRINVLMDANDKLLARAEKAEAELDIERGARDDFKRAWESEKAWREKAEAEVERLLAASYICPRCGTTVDIVMSGTSDPYTYALPNVNEKEEA